jgi:iron complex outermembrane recepter protein
MGPPRLRAPGLAAALALMLSAPDAAWAERAGSGAPRGFNIAAQPLAGALLQLSRQGDVDIIAPERLTRGHAAPMVAGTMTADQALARLLAGSGMQFSISAEGSFIIAARTARIPRPPARRAPPASPPRSTPPVIVDEVPTDDIVVTAQRRSEDIRNVPISVGVFGPGTLAELGIRGTDQLQFATPGLVNTQTSGDGISTAYIRGVGTGYSGPGLESSVAVYLDDVYLQSQTESAQAVVDIAQIQVLKGPQGTLYGRNATGGAIVITTADPRLDRVEGYARLGVGNLAWRRGEAVANLPLGPTVAARFAGFHESRDGYVRNLAFPQAKPSGVGAGETWAARLKLLWQPDDDFAAILKGQYDRHNGNGAIHRLRYTSAGTLTDLGYYRTIQSPNREGGGGDDTSALALSARLEYRTGDWTVTDTIGYRRTRSYGCTDNDGLPAEILYFCLVSQRSPDPGTAHGKQDQTFTNELRLVSDLGGWIDLTAGLFYERNRGRFVGRVGGTSFGALTPTFDNRDHLEAYSGFAELYVRLAERLRLTGGLRYTYERKYHAVALDADAQALGPAWPVFDAARKRYTDLSPRLVLAWDADRLSYYASYNRGFKSGGFNSPAATIDPALDPETIDAFEIGAKYRSPGGKTRITTALYRYNWKDVQVAFITGGGAGILQQNAARAHIWGGELNFDHVTRRWRVNLGLAYSHGRFASFSNAAVYDVIDGRLQANAQDLKGYRLPQAPDLTASGSLTWYFGLPGQWSGSMTAAGRGSSGYDFTAGGGGELRASRQKAFALVNLTGAFTSPDEVFEIGWFVSNLFRQTYISLISTGDTGVYMTPAEPRVYGLSFRRSF